MANPQLPKRSKRTGVGKEIGGAIYLHREYESKLGEAVEVAKQFLPAEFDYSIVKLNLKSKSVSFICCDGFDTHHEPEVGDSILVRTDGTWKKRSKARDPEIYHHKWLFVAENYDGFDIDESRNRSASWLGLEGLNRRKIGKRSYWVENVLPLLNEQPEDKTDKLHPPNKISTKIEAISSDIEIARHKTAIKPVSYTHLTLPTILLV